MVVDLVVQTVGQGLVLPEAGQQRDPVVQLKGLVFRTQVTIEVRDDFDETSHDKRKETNAAKHDEDTDYLFEIGNWVDIAVSNGCEGGDSEVTTGDKSLNSVEFWLIKRVNGYKSPTI